MRLLLGSGGFRTDQRRALYVERMQRHFGDIERVLFIPWALHDHDRYVSVMGEKGLDAGYVLEGIHRFDDPISAVERCEGIYIGGGNTFRLTDQLHRSGVMDLIRSRVADGLPYMGVSAGTNVACPTMQTTNDMPIIMPPSFDAIGLVPFQINAHYYDGQIYVKSGDDYVEHFGETRDDRIREFHEMNEHPVVGLWEGGFLEVEDQDVRLVGSDARLFLRGESARDVTEADGLSMLMTSSS
ncbi:MAG: dipeptidase PepE [Phycisphaerae bacterium]|nr:dipeptidase PepE [Phycisphaerae bacterium]|tara:strand:- start:142 stop:864 length:723 start_codon:yes stop_codon:yes gene_type:complete